MNKMNRFRNKYGAWLLAMLMGFFSFNGAKAASSEEVDVQNIVFSHIQDSYTWHITEWGETEIAIPLPVIVWSEDKGLDIFLSSQLHEGQTYHGYQIAEEGDYAGKIVTQNAKGEWVRPVDLSLTKDVCALLVATALLLGIILKTASWYKKHPGKAPGGFVGMIEATVMYIEEEVILRLPELCLLAFGKLLLILFIMVMPA